ncbi:MAG: hypothetical protein ABEH43_08965 [Flavobacteriales bacterium]
MTNLNGQKLAVKVGLGGWIHESGHHWKLFVGSGLEFVDHKSLFMYRLGSAYEIDVWDHFLLSPSMSLEVNEEEKAFVYVLNVGVEF